MNGGAVSLTNYGKVNIYSTTLSNSIGVSGLLVSAINYCEIYCEGIVISNCQGY